MEKIKNTKKGFSLMELLIVLAIVIIMTGVLLRNFNSNQKDGKDLELEGRKFVAVLESLQNDALAGVNAGACEYIVTVPDGGKPDYAISGCSSSSSKLSASVVFKDPQSMSFTLPSAKVKDVSGIVLPNKSVDFILTKNSKTYTVSVYGSGNITEKLN